MYWTTGCPDIWLKDTLGMSVSVCLGGCFWMRLTFESVDWVKQIAFPNLDAPCPIHGEPEENKKASKRTRSSCLSLLNLGHWSPAFKLRLELTPLAFLLLRTLNSDWNYTISFPGSPGLPTAAPGTSQPPWPVSQPLITNYICIGGIYICVCIYIYTHTHIYKI